MNAKALGMWVILSAIVWQNLAFAEPRTFNPGQLWKCLNRHENASLDQRIQFLVTGIATQREVSRRSNFQNDDPVVSVAIVDLDPTTCATGSHFLHMAFSEEALLACAPVLVDEDNRLSSPNAWKAARDARGSWLIGMQSNKGAMINVNPSRYLALMKRMRCRKPITE